ncbi:Eco57I restriction-modification methylase domain-containing protein [Selenihalanaerobacter shriftii]|uniref:site-specific DNA-methyltransferase (adenine-specific) n=1 Tax=Selenihalanaerobacter shriftii TaxID=142842 RepID=A0A1T4MLP0_9FIRM|nr:N-6 DNA methylase [Selenihalanaerobacter shriftii]SJZ67863.1 TaqI-like C-terminal specificity domain-containing protein [Selenihalanaerobacter shriftii]
MDNLFNKKVLKAHLNKHSILNYKTKIDTIKSWKRNLKSIIGANEERLQASFLKGIFGIVLGYKDMTEAGEEGEYTLQIEPSTEVDATKPDGSLGFYYQDEESKTEAVIELKGPKVSLDKKQKRSGKHYGTPVEQAFSYASKYDGCKWVIVSNMIEIRLYSVIRGQGYYEEFRIEELDLEDNFKKFHLLLSRKNLINKQDKSNTLRLSEQTQKKEEDISIKFYNLYKQTRVELFEHLKVNNPNYDEELLLEKAQKFLDRIIFICFCEDLGLLPAEILHQAIESGKSSYSFSEVTIWQEIKGIFRAIDKGSEPHNINAYNGGLFKADEVLDNLIIKNDFFDVIDKISAYDFDSELDVNILGHVFEQSISDIEEIKADIENDEYNEKESKRKKDGIYYTPEYITKYIVENSVGKCLEDIRKELGEEELPDIEEAATPQVEGKYKKQHLEFYKEYEERLKKIKVLDPACGSGAFLNQAFDFLLKEYQWIHRQIDLIQEGQRSIFGLESLQKEILKNNIYGVDINESSVEITKLSLWLKTANKNKPLTNLDDNIKCGNSLIDDPEVAGDKAFKWKEEFSEIMADGGFDVVIGNPPYVVLSPHELREFQMSKGNFNTYTAFAELATEIINYNGKISFIIPITWLAGEKYYDFRYELLSKYNILEIIQLPYDRFNAYVDTLILSFEKADNISPIVKTYKFPIHERQNQINIDDFQKINKKFWENNEGKVIFLEKDVINIKIKYNNTESVNLKEIATVNRGTLPPKEYMIADKNEDSTIRWFDGQIYRYLQTENAKKIFVDHTKLKENKPLELFNTDKIFGRQLVSRQFRLMFTYVDSSFAFKKNLYAICLEDENYLNKYLLAILNSKLYSYIQIKTNPSLQRDDFPSFSLNDFRNFKIPKISKEKQQPFIKKADFMIEGNKKLAQLRQTNFIDLINKYTSKAGPQLTDIVEEGGFYNKIYSGRARKVREMTVNINDTILTIYADKSSSGKYELMKFEVKDKYKRQYIKYYLEKFTEKQLEEADNFSGGLVKKVLQVELPDYNKYQVVRKVVNEWNQLQREIDELRDKIEETDRKIDEMVYELYGLTEEEIEIVEESLEDN